MYVRKIITYLLVSNLVFCSKIKKVVKFDRYEACEVPESSPYNFSNINIISYGHGSAVETRLEVARDIKVLKVITRVTRCHNKEHLDSCEYFTTVRLDNACPYIAGKNTIFTPVIYAHRPPYLCPIRKGTYVCTNGTFDPNVLNLFPLENFYWKFVQHYYEGGSNNYLYAICVEGQVISVRN